MQVLEIADAAGPGDNPQLVKNRCDQRRWLAGKYNALYSDKRGAELLYAKLKGGRRTR
jgi:hypothetical protein